LPVIPSKRPVYISSGAAGRRGGGRKEGRDWCRHRKRADSKGRRIDGKINILNEKKFLALNFKLLVQMTGDSITDSNVLKVITSAMESHSDYSLRDPRTSCTAVSNWVTRAFCNTVPISWLSEANR